MATIEFFYDYASPFSYFADHRMAGVIQRTGATLVYRPAILGVVIIESKNTPPPSIPAKIAYYQHDIARWAKRLNVPMNPNPFFPVRSINIMRAALVAQDMGCFEAFHQAMWRGMWVQQLNLAEPQIICDTLDAAGLDGKFFVAATQNDTVKGRLKANCDEALTRGAFGLPTFFVDEQMFFGNDRVDFVEEAVAGTTRHATS